MTVMYWLGAGALVGAVMAAFSLPLWSQIIAFVIVSVILLILTRPWALKYLNSRTVRTNADSLIGQTALVKETINNMESKGLVQLNGQDWTARSFEAGEIIPEGSEVIVKEIRGVKLIVEREV